MTPHIDPERHLQQYIENRKIKKTGSIDTPLDIPVITLDQRNKGLRQPESCPSVDRC